MTSRGCPFNCSFCVLDKLSKRKVRYRSPENVIEETVNETIDFVKELQKIKPLYYKDMNIAMIYPGTKIYYPM